MEIEIFEVEGMKCEGCEKKIQDALEAIAGVTSATADHNARTVEITYDSTLTTVDALKTVIESEGYIVVA